MDRLSATKHNLSLCNLFHMFILFSQFTMNEVSFYQLLHSLNALIIGSFYPSQFNVNLPLQCQMHSYFIHLLVHKTITRIMHIYLLINRNRGQIHNWAWKVNKVFYCMQHEGGVMVLFPQGRWSLKRTVIGFFIFALLTRYKPSLEKLEFWCPRDIQAYS